MVQTPLRSEISDDNAESAAAERPRASEPSQPLRFILERHDARRMHFDLRLELDGAFKCWAVMNGVSLDPAERRLAVRTEDLSLNDRPHELDRSNIIAFEDGFDGSAPRDMNELQVWDCGEWRAESDAREGFKDGKLVFTLEGTRLNGRFVLQRLGKIERAKRENWLLTKLDDGAASGAAKGRRRFTDGRSRGDDLSSVEQARTVKRASPMSTTPKGKIVLPEFIAPQLATLVTEAPEGEQWVHEIKYDGYRAVAALGEGHARIYTRSGQDWSAKFPGIVAALRKIKIASALVDGEIVALDAKGKSSFAGLQQGLKSGNVPLVYYVFDLLELDGHDLRSEPLIERKKKLRKLLQKAPDEIRFSDYVVGHGHELFARACRMGLEGIVSKRADKSYESKRSQSWLKTKCTGDDEFVIGGYRVSDKKGRAFASLLIGEFKGKDLHYCGRVGTGFDEQDLESLGAKFAKLARKTCPFVEVPREIARDARWVDPKLVAQIAFTERTRDGLLRHPAFLGLRQDKPAREVQEQRPVPTAKAEAAARRGNSSAKPRSKIRVSRS
jgi:bifunctional non-homologous end joining protein LigD